MVTDDPFGPPPDATFIRPRPGAGRKGTRPEGLSSPAAGSGLGYAESARDLKHDFLGTGLNPLMRAASPVLLLAGRLRKTVSVSDVAGLRRDALAEIRNFEDRAQSLGVRPEAVTAARYALCASVDEAVLATPWGGESDWAHLSLLLELHNEAQGGEKFFDVLEGISEQPARHIDLMELYYVCLAFGFAGKYEAIDHGHTKLATIQRDLHRRIRAERGAHADELSIHWRGLEDRRNPIIRYRLWWVFGAVALGLLAVAYFAYWGSLARLATPLLTELDSVGRDQHTQDRIFEEPAPGPTLKQLLEPEERAGDLRVEEVGGRTRVVLLATDLFASGRAELNPQHDSLLRQVANALEHVPGAVLVEGHTDSVPISARYSSNFELSQQRAAGVAAILRSLATRPERVDSVGHGSSVPRVLPGTAAENRRVEIVHTPPTAL